MTGASPEYRAARIDALKHAIDAHIVVTDGAMGTMIQNLKLAESDFRGTRFAEFPSDLKGNNDILNLTQPQHIAQIHKSFLAAGAQIICTNTFNANSIAQSDYNMQSEVVEINHAGARLARNIADEWNAQHRDKICFVAGAMGPTNRTASISPDVTDPAYRNVTFDALVQAYSEAASALLSGGADFLLLETIFDTLNAKAAIFAVLELREKYPYPIELIISGTITDLSGRTLSGQTIEAFWNSVRHAAPLAVGLNCALGAKQLRPYLVDLSRIADIPVIAYPNAGLPNEMGEYDETPQATAEHLGEWAHSGLINIVGGCCGTTPQHIRAISDSLAECPPRPIPEIERRMRLSGLEPFEMA